MKKIICFVFAVMMILSCLTGLAAPAQKELNVVTTIFPIYDWVREIAGDTLSGISLTMLLDSGTDLHSYQPTAQDILKISTADLFIHVGGESDKWVGAVLASAMNPDVREISLVEAMGEDIKIEEIVEGMEHEHDHDHEEEDEHDHEGEDHDHEEHDHDHEHEEEADEHVWLSLRNAEKLVYVISEAMAEIDPENADVYRSNTVSYIEKLAALDAEYAEAVESAACGTLLFGDRFPFRYLADDYGLDYFAAFSGCSAESEASFQTIMFLAQKVDELDLPAVLTIEHPKARIAETIISTTQKKDQKILSMDSMQGTTSSDVQAGATYYGIMESNLAVLKEALNR